MKERLEETTEAEDQLHAGGGDRPASSCAREGSVSTPFSDGRTMFFWAAMTAALLLLVQLAVMLDERYLQAFAEC